ncbi:hypothetical protein K505DRAFT_379903 [Melanomma pulvis-pyrius CBS 109.77]|uniref:Uncharacterized protein n=1 Tax=Melanomma pulvis-pyrius CBS 109.77 TaxID=1314802 RepID=A0A6A6WSC1_9PLEO|nr:hypothetical protein K505DRAFT_379903 [Melanomma pulvis-pyrius CBS 109.77]
MNLAVIMQHPVAYFLSGCTVTLMVIGLWLYNKAPIHLYGNHLHGKPSDLPHYFEPETAEATRRLQKELDELKRQSTQLHKQLARANSMIAVQSRDVASHRGEKNALRGILQGVEQELERERETLIKALAELKEEQAKAAELLRLHTAAEATLMDVQTKEKLTPPSPEIPSPVIDAQADGPAKKKKGRRRKKRAAGQNAQETQGSQAGEESDGVALRTTSGAWCS